MNPRARDLGLIAGLVILTLAVFGRVLGHEFTTFDDPLYVSANEIVKRGLTADGIRYAFTTFDTGNWFPLTWLSLMFDTTLFGARAGAMAFVNVLLHASSTVVLFLALRRLSEDVWPPAVVAALFAVHPAHVESVAWISERKDVLSTLFAFGTLLAYAWFARGRSARAYALLIAAFVFGLLSKSMLVTIPFGLLLLDLWPLRRFGREPVSRLVLEKAPLFALAAASSVITVLAQRAGGAVANVDALPLVARLENAIVSYVRYLGMLVFPTRLAVFYPYDYTISTAQLAGSILVLAALTAIAVWLWRDAGWLFTGWFWFAGTLVPVIGLLQVGLQSIADRYTYIPSVGIFMIAAWGGAALARRGVVSRPVVAATAAAVIAVLAAAACVQTGVWRNSITLFSHAVKVTRDNGLAHFNLGLALREAGRGDESLMHFREATAAALRATPPREIDGRMVVTFASWFARAQSEAGAELIEGSKSLRAAGREEEAQRATAEALGRLEQAMKIDPSLAEAKANLAAAYALSGRTADATRLGASSYDEHLNLGAVLSRDGKIDEAITHFRAAAKMDPASVEPMIYVGLGLAQAGRTREAIDELSRALAKDRRAANAFLTSAVRLPASDSNLEEYIAYLRTQP